MNMNLQAQLEAMQASFERLQDSESKVSNIKQRIFLMQKLMGEDPEKRSVPPTHAQNYTPKNVDTATVYELYEISMLVKN